MGEGELNKWVFISLLKPKQFSTLLLKEEGNRRKMVREGIGEKKGKSGEERKGYMWLCDMPPKIKRKVMGIHFHHILSLFKIKVIGEWKLK